MHYETVKTTVIRDYKADRQRETTLGHVLIGGIPASTELFDRIHSGIIAGYYDGDAESLIADLKLDLGLLSRVVPLLKSGDAGHGYISPLEDLRGLSIKELAAIIPKSPRLVSRHRLDNGTPKLRAAIASSVSSTAATETFAVEAARRGLAIDPGEAYSVSLLRQLGLNLLAWNYPTNFFRILRGLGNQPVAHDRELKRLFGFTPLSLASACARRWNIKPGIQDAIEAKDGWLKANPLREVCELGDIFGRRMHGEIFPGAEKEWNDSAARVGDLIGTDKVNEISEQVEANLERRLQLIFKTEPKRFNQVFDRVRPVQKKSFWVENPFLKKLPEKISSELEQVHNELQSEGGVISALTSLTGKAIPNSGFVRGIICVTDDQSQMLRLAVRIGLKADDVTQIKRLAAAAVEARDSSIPLLKEVRSTRGTVTRISSNFSGVSQSGVLVLELSEDAAADSERDNLVYFRAVRKCLECCLNSQDPAITS